MNEFLQVILSFPTVPFTVLLGVVLCYWVFVTVGAVGTDLFEGGGGELAEGDLGGAETGGGELEAGGDPGAAAKGLVQDAAHGSSLLAWLGLGKVPITVSSSALAFWGWLFSALGMIHLAPRISDPPGLLAKLSVLALALLGALLASSVALRPLHRLFEVKELEKKSALLGKVCTITSGKVDGGFGTASFEDGGAGFLLKVICAKANELKKGEQALILDYDPRSDTYEIEPVDWLLPQELGGAEDPLRCARNRSKVT